MDETVANHAFNQFYDNLERECINAYSLRTQSSEERIAAIARTLPIDDSLNKNDHQEQILPSPIWEYTKSLFAYALAKEKDPKLNPIEVAFPNFQEDLISSFSQFFIDDESLVSDIHNVYVKARNDLALQYGKDIDNGAYMLINAAINRYNIRLQNERFDKKIVKRNTLNPEYIAANINYLHTALALSQITQIELLIDNDELWSTLIACFDVASEYPQIADAVRRTIYLLARIDPAFINDIKETLFSEKSSIDENSPINQRFEDLLIDMKLIYYSFSDKEWEQFLLDNQSNILPHLLIGYFMNSHVYGIFKDVPLYLFYYKDLIQEESFFGRILQFITHIQPQIEQASSFALKDSLITTLSIMCLYCSIAFSDEIDRSNNQEILYTALQDVWIKNTSRPNLDQLISSPLYKDKGFVSRQELVAYLKEMFLNETNMSYQEKMSANIQKLISEIGKEVLTPSLLYTLQHYIEIIGDPITSDDFHKKLYDLLYEKNNSIFDSDEIVAAKRILKQTDISSDLLNYIVETIIPPKIIPPNKPLQDLIPSDVTPLDEKQTEKFLNIAETIASAPTVANNEDFHAIMFLLIYASRFLHLSGHFRVEPIFTMMSLHNQSPEITDKQIAGVFSRFNKTYIELVKHARGNLQSKFEQYHSVDLFFLLSHSSSSLASNRLMNIIKAISLPSQ